MHALCIRYDTLLANTAVLCMHAYVSFVFRHMTPAGECYYNILLACDYFSSLSVVSHTFSALCVHSKLGHHPHPQAGFVPNFVSFVPSIAELAYGEKSHTQLMTYLMPQEPKLAVWKKPTIVKKQESHGL